MGIFDKANEMKEKAAALADQAKDVASKVPGGEGIADKIDEVTSKVPGMETADVEAEAAEAPEAE